MNIRSVIYPLLLCVTIALSGCSTEIDNWNYPTSTVSGQFLYKGQPMELMGTASDATGSNMLQLHQVGGEWIQGFVKVFSREDGTYTVNTFDGEYYLNLTPGRGPWVPNHDTLRVSVKGHATNVNFEVTPYFWISNYTSSFADSVFTASFNLEKVVPSAVLDRVVINLGTTAIVDNISKNYEKSITTASPGTNTVSVDLKMLSNSEKANLRKTGLLFGRIGVKAQGTADLIYSKTVKLE